VPVLEGVSGLKFNVDFFCGYSPGAHQPGRQGTPPALDQEGHERQHPRSGGRRQCALRPDHHRGHAQGQQHQGSGAAKVIENTQRDVNIALMNELSLIFHKLGIDTLEVLQAAGTKWNFLPFRPGLVGGHCIGVDPYYLTHKAQEVGYHPEVILAGRRINDNMARHVADETVKLMLRKGLPVLGSKVLVLGLTFKENCPDVRNTKVVDIVRTLQGYNTEVDVYDPWISVEDAEHEYGPEVPEQVPATGKYAAIVLAVGQSAVHRTGRRRREGLRPARRGALRRQEHPADGRRRRPALIPSPMTAYQELLARLPNEPRTWLVTGVAGFIGSNLLETLLKLDQRVVGLDNFATGFERNLDEVRGLVAPAQWARFAFHKGDIRNLDDCRRAVEGVDHVLHQAALGSVPRSLADPITTDGTNIGGFLNMLVAARDAKVKSFTYAASSSTYGDHPGLPKVEDRIGKPLVAVCRHQVRERAVRRRRSRAATVSSDRPALLQRVRQRGRIPTAPTRRSFPKWTGAMIGASPSHQRRRRDQPRLLLRRQRGAGQPAGRDDRSDEARNQVYNVAVGGRTTLNHLFEALQRALAENGVQYGRKPVYREFRAGDVRHSQADVGKARSLLGYEPRYDILAGIRAAMPWYVRFLSLGIR
jgi:UDP-N-acetylglucosamine 4-epimerase